jgi:cobalamin biosynthesis protein CobT
LRKHSRTKLGGIDATGIGHDVVCYYRRAVRTVDAE